VTTPTPPVAAAPEVACPDSISVTAVTSAGRAVTYRTPDSSKGQGDVSVNCSPASGATFPIGATQVECVATDSLNRTGSCRFSVTVAAPPRLRRTRIMAFGDSITEGQVIVPNTESAELVDTPNSYPVVMAGLLGARYTDQRIEVFNRGKATERSELALSRFTGSFGIDRPDTVVLLEGYNDIIFAPTTALGILAAEAGVSALAADARNRGARVFICTLTPGKIGRRQIANSAIQAVNERLRVVARGEGAYLIDLYSALALDIEGNISSDGLHLTELGYKRVAETVFAAIRDDLEIK
jgi:lysophospholipase L1-like esterase